MSTSKDSMRHFTRASRTGENGGTLRAMGKSTGIFRFYNAGKRRRWTASLTQQHPPYFGVSYSLSLEVPEESRGGAAMDVPAFPSVPKRELLAGMASAVLGTISRYPETKRSGCYPLETGNRLMSGLPRPLLSGIYLSGVSGSLEAACTCM